MAISCTSVYFLLTTLLVVVLRIVSQAPSVPGRSAEFDNSWIGSIKKVPAFE